MKKLQALIRYEFETTFKYIFLFYAICYSVIALVYLFILILQGHFEDAGTSCLDMNSLVFLSIISSVGFTEDFRMHIQNGFTRKYIFIGTTSLFAAMALTMSLIDTLVANLMQYLTGNYHSVFTSLYGNAQPWILSWLWLFVLYLCACCLCYFITLVINRIGGRLFLIISLGGALFISLSLSVLFRLVLPAAMIENIIRILVMLFGFMTNGGIQVFYPILLFSSLSTIIMLSNYHLIKRMEIKR